MHCSTDALLAAGPAPQLQRTDFAKVWTTACCSEKAARQSEFRLPPLISCAPSSFHRFRSIRRGHNPAGCSQAAAKATVVGRSAASRKASLGTYDPRTLELQEHPLPKVG